MNHTDFDRHCVEKTVPYVGMIMAKALQQMKDEAPETVTCVFNAGSDLVIGKVYEVTEFGADVKIGDKWYFKDRFIEYRNFRIKPLVWEKLDDFYHYTDTILGKVTISTGLDGWYVGWDGDQYTKCDSIEHGQQLATEWYFGKLLEVLEAV